MKIYNKLIRLLKKDLDIKMILFFDYAVIILVSFLYFAYLTISFFGKNEDFLNQYWLLFIVSFTYFKKDISILILRHLFIKCKQKNIKISKKIIIVLSIVNIVITIILLRPLYSLLSL